MLPAKSSVELNLSPCCSFHAKVVLATIGVALAVIFGVLVILGSYHLPLGPINVISKALGNFAFLPLTLTCVMALALGGVIWCLRRKSLSQEVVTQQQQVVVNPEPVPQKVVYEPQQQAEQMHTYLDSIKAQLTDQEREWIDRFREDIERVLQDQALSEAEKGEILYQMREAVPYRLGEQLVVSPYPLVGIPNFGGNNCFLNASLQALVHTRMGDYYLWCPPHKPIQPVVNPLPLPPQKPELTDYNFEGAKNDNERKTLSQQYDTAKQVFKKEEENYEELQWQHNLAEGRANQYPEELRRYKIKLKMQTTLRTIVLGMRREKAPSQEQIDTLLKSIGYGYGSWNAGGSHENFLGHICMDGSPILAGNMEQQQQGPVIILGSGKHYKVIVQSARGFSTIDDNRISFMNHNDPQKIYQQIDRDRRAWQPYQPTVSSNRDWQNNPSYLN